MIERHVTLCMADEAKVKVWPEFSDVNVSAVGPIVELGTRGRDCGCAGETLQNRLVTWATM